MRVQRPRRLSGSGAVLALFSLIVLVTAGLSWEAVRNAGAARAAAQGVLTDYAAFAASMFARETESRLNGHLMGGINAARAALARPATSSTPPDLTACHCPIPLGFQTAFALYSSGLLIQSGASLDGPSVAVIRDDQTKGTFRDSGHVRVIDGTGRVVLATSARLDTESVTLGFVAGGDLLQHIFNDVLEKAVLLPRTLVDQGRVTDVVSVRVSDERGSELFAAGQAPSGLSGSAALSDRFGSLRVTVGIRPERAGALVIGGLPSDRRPLALGLLALALGLVAAAAVQVRRELRFVRQRADFVAGVSHELRTPLAQIRLFGETLWLGRVRSRDEERRAAAIIVQESRRLTHIVDNVLQFSRGSRGGTVIRPEMIDAVAVTQEVVASFQIFAEAKEARIALDHPDQPPLVAIDPSALRQILLNLLDNAVKYGPRGQVVRVSLEVTAQALTVVVEDEGPGIPEDERPRVWQPFWRAQAGSEGGTGLGLAIVSDLVRSHGGAATVGDAASGGARFVITLRAGGLAANSPPESAVPQV